MEDLLQFLFIAFIVISFLRRFFKKPPEANKNNQQGTAGENKPVYYPPKEEDAAVKRPSSDDFDILREIENMFKQETEKVNPPQPASQPASRPIESKTRLEEHSQRSDERTQWGAEKTQRESERTQRIGERTQSASERTIKVQKIDTSRSASETQMGDVKRRVVTKEIEEKAKQFEKYATSYTLDDYSKFSSGLRDRFLTPATLKDAVIMAEILGKPKAFE